MEEADDEEEHIFLLRQFNFLERTDQQIDGHIVSIQRFFQPA